MRFCLTWQWCTQCTLTICQVYYCPYTADYVCVYILIYCFHGSPFQHIHLILHRTSWGIADVTISTTTHLGRRSSGPQRISFSCDGDLVELCHPQICPKTFNYMVLSENIVPNRYSISPRRWQSLGKDLGAVSHHQPFCKRQPLKTLKKSWGEYMWGGHPCDIHDHDWSCLLPYHPDQILAGIFPYISLH